MNKHRIFEADGFRDDLEDILGKSWSKLYAKITEYVYPQLTRQPYFGQNIKKLKGYNPPTWRYRLGDIRIFYEIDSKGRIVIMTAANLRKDVYR